MAVEEMPDIQTIDEWRLDQVTRIIGDRDSAIRWKAVYRAAFGVTLGVLLVVVFT